MANGLGVGDAAPDFTLANAAGEPVRFSDLWRAGPVVLFFYPKDNTVGCTAEVCAFRDSYEVFTDAGTTVVGISSDSVDSHARFASRHRLPFTLLSDAGGQVRSAFGVPRSLGLLDGRVTYVVDTAGVIRHQFRSQSNIGKHVSTALEVVRGLASQAH